MRRLLIAPALSVTAACGTDTTGGADGGRASGGRDEAETAADAPLVEVAVAEDTRTEPRVRRTEPDGAPCTTSDACISRTCMTGDQWPGGYCTGIDCAAHGDCASPDSACVPVDGRALCGDRCLEHSDCRPEYVCARIGETFDQVCLIGERPTGLADGEPCGADGDCAGGTCLPDPYYPGGYCTTVGCDDNLDCARLGFDNQCLRQPDGSSFCVRVCAADVQCRDSYGCIPVGRRDGICGPVEQPPEPFDPADYPIPITCVASDDTREVAIDYEVTEGTRSYAITPFALDGFPVRPTHIDTPSGALIDFATTNWFQLIPSMLFGFINPIVVPATPALAAQLEVGAHTLHVSTESQHLCWYLLEKSTDEAELRLRVHLTGVPGVTAESAPGDGRVTAALDFACGVFATQGITCLPPVFADADPAFAVIRSQFDAQELVQRSTVPDGDGADVRVMNVYLTASFAFGGVIGISMGLPGAPALHGTRASGVVLTSEYLDVPSGPFTGPEFTGQILAHEVGHFLGLLHTTEQGAEGTDPLDDTPECVPWDPDRCPDRTNLMFPFAGGGVILSPHQGLVLLSNPLVH